VHPKLKKKQNTRLVEAKFKTEWPKFELGSKRATAEFELTAENSSIFWVTNHVLCQYPF